MKVQLVGGAIWDLAHNSLSFPVSSSSLAYALMSPTWVDGGGACGGYAASVLPGLK